MYVDFHWVNVLAHTIWMVKWSDEFLRFPVFGDIMSISNSPAHTVASKEMSLLSETSLEVW